VFGGKIPESEKKAGLTTIASLSRLRLGLSREADLLSLV